MYILPQILIQLQMVLSARGGPRFDLTSFTLESIEIFLTIECLNDIITYLKIKGGD